MEKFFLGIYRFFEKRRILFWMVFGSTILVLLTGAYAVRLEENITRFFPDDERVEKLNTIFQNSSFADKVVVMISVKDSTQKLTPDSLTNYAGQVANRLETDLQPYEAEIASRVDDERLLEVFQIAQQHLPLFLTAGDYAELDSLTQPEASRARLREQYQQLLAPSGFVLKNMIVKDPMGFTNLVLRKLQQLQYDDNFELYDNYIITRDHRHVVFFVQPGHESSDTGQNADFVNALHQISEAYSTETILVSYFGATAVAVGNAQQLRHDIQLTISLLIVLLGIFIIGFFRNVQSLVFILIPAVFGGLFSLSCIYLIKGTVSILALAAGSVILGIAVNYALHFLVHYRYHPNKEQVIKDLVKPMTLGSLTTVLAFFSLQFTSAAVLQDLGLFAGFSLIGAALCSLIFFPHFITQPDFKETAFDRAFVFKKSPGRIPVFIILLLTPVFFHFASQVNFNSNMGSLNFMNENTRQAQERLEAINPASLHSLYVSSDAPSLQQALQKMEQAIPAIESLEANGIIQRTLTPSSFLLSDSLQRIRIQQWHTFWNTRKEAFFQTVKEEGARLKFSAAVLANVDSVVDRNYALMNATTFNTLKNLFFRDNIIERNEQATVISLINVLPEDKAQVQQTLASAPASLLDRQMITTLFVEFIHEDFNFIVTFTAILVFVVLLISTGRIELTIVTFTPMLITWIWILGIMALVGIEFNIINVIISTFIFGLGDDYSIFVMDGLQQEYKSGKQNLPSVRVSIALSTLTTVSGLGVLIFAEHPALRSIAAIAIIGIVCVFIMSQVIEPFLFSNLITNRTFKKLPPVTAKGLFFTTLTYSLFVFGSLFLTVVGLLMLLIPFARKRVRLAYHHLIRFFTRSVVYLALNLKKRITKHNTDIFQRPGIIIANHSSFLDILITTMLHPRVVLLTNKWVWNSPVFGGVVRLAGYYPVEAGAEGSIDQLKNRIDEGYSVVVFPEGTRSKDGTIGRFHKGAFFMAEKFQLPIYPVLISGASRAIPKSTWYVNEATVAVSMLSGIEATDTHFGATYQEKTKAIARYFKESHAQLEKEVRTPKEFRHSLYNNYRYKGPVLEWYLRIKLRMENYYQIFDELVPKKASVLDLGCGYGFLCYQLQFLSTERTITGIDHDEEKIMVAQHGYLRSDKLQFNTANVAECAIAPHDAIIIADVLHYLLPQQQEALLVKCFEAVLPDGKIIIRDGDADLIQRHKATRFTEVLSVSLLGFNRAENPLNFISGSWLKLFCQQHGFKVETIDQYKATSNIIFVITKATV